MAGLRADDLCLTSQAIDVPADATVKGTIMFDILGVTALLSVATLGTWLALRARRAKNRVVKWVGLALSSVLTLACTLVTGVALVGFYKLNFPPRRPAVTDVKVAVTPGQVARGARFSVLCPLCHSPAGKAPLVGQDFSKGGPPVGTLYAPNLTPAGEIKDWSDGDIIRAIREGVHKSGRALIIMPSEVFRNLSDVDVEAIVAYLRSQPAVEPNTPPARLNVVAAVLIGAGLPRTSAQPPITQPIVAPAQGVSADYGKYLVSILGCRLCHGESLAGRQSGGPGPPAGPNLTLILPKWSVEDFIHTIRTGVDPYNRTLAEGMPWKELSTFASDEDLAALYAYLHSLTPIEGPAR
jgi:mono/diheme cytochrome c family protein